jgi:hypothetical protein
MTKETLPTVEEALDEIKSKPAVDIWPTMCVALGIAKGTGYAAVNRGEIEVLEVGRLKKVITSSLRKKLGIEGA